MSRHRALAALLALFGFTAYFAESLIAVACSPGVESHAAAPPLTGTGGAAGLHHGSPGDPAAPHEPAGDDPETCPLGMPGGVASCLGVALPGINDSIRAAVASGDSGFTAPRAVLSQLLPDDHFRPPRA